MTADKTLHDSPCTSCAREKVVEATPIINDISRSLVVQAPRTKVKTDTKGKIVYDKNNNIIQTKLHTKVDFPSKPLDLSAALGVGSGSDGTKYEVFGIVEHLGSGYVLPS